MLTACGQSPIFSFSTPPGDAAGVAAHAARSQPTAAAASVRVRHLEYGIFFFAPL